MFKTPQFWLKLNWISLILLPLTLLYKLGFYLKKKITKTHFAKIPVICVGNITAGGSGKTPFAIALGQYFHEKNINFCYLTRGYKAQNKAQNSGVIYLDNSQNYSAHEVGDEPLLLSEVAPVFVAKNRWLGCQEIEKKPQFKAIIMDDGLQNFQLKHDIKILVIDGKIGFGNSLLLPSGPLRQSLSSVIKDVDLFVLIGEDFSAITQKILSQKPQAQIIKTQVNIKNLESFKNKNFIAFCGIAFPQKFFDLLIKSNLTLLETHAFSDHHNYQIHEIEKLLARAKNNNCRLLTTKKDWVKFSNKTQKEIDFVDIDLDLKSCNSNDEILKKIFTKYFKNV